MHVLEVSWMIILLLLVAWLEAQLALEVVTWMTHGTTVIIHRLELNGLK